MEGNRDPRGMRMLAAMMSFGDCPAQRIIVKDLSCRGLGARATRYPPPVGMIVTISFSQGTTLTGQVRWASGNRFGALLDQEINPDEFRGAGDGWDGAANRTFPSGHVFDQFKPVASTHRPGFKVR